MPTLAQAWVLAQLLINDELPLNARTREAIANGWAEEKAGKAVRTPATRATYDAWYADRKARGVAGMGTGGFFRDTPDAPFTKAEAALDGEHVHGFHARYPLEECRLCTRSDRMVRAHRIGAHAEAFEIDCPECSLIWAPQVKDTP